MRRRLSLESLEVRVMPAVFGTPWPDASHLTVSFVADSTPVDTASTGTGQQGGQSSLFSSMAQAGLTQAQWQGQILRALQTWASAANIDVTVVPDDGEALGTAGAIQGDPRFGDIRIAGMDLGSTALAITTPFSTVAGTSSGDIIFNTNYAFGIGAGGGDHRTYDIFSVAMHEEGHALGLDDNSTDKSSVMYENYQGVRSGLGALDVSEIQQLYGARTPDAFGGDDVTSLAAAALDQFARSVHTLGRQATLPAGSPLQVVGDLATQASVDSFSYQATTVSPGFTVSLQTADLGMLAGRVTVLDEHGSVVGQATASTPGQDLVLSVAATPRQKFVIQVDSTSNDPFGIGRYRLAVDPNDSAVTDRLAARESLMLDNAPANDGLQTAVHLSPLVAGNAAVGAYAVQGRLAANASDYYHLDGSAHSTSLTVFLSGTGVLGLTVLDKDGNVLAQRTADGSLSLTLDDLPAHGGIDLVVTGATATGYRLSALRNSPAVDTPLTTSGTMTGSANSVPFTTEALLIPTATLVRLDLLFTSAQAGTTVAVTVFDSRGTVVYSQLVPVNQQVSLSLSLAADGYTLAFIGSQPGDDIAFGLSAFLLSDPIGSALIDPNAPPPPPPPDPSWFNLSSYIPIGLLGTVPPMPSVPIVLTPPSMPPLPPSSAPVMPPAPIPTPTVPPPTMP